MRERFSRAEELTQLEHVLDEARRNGAETGSAVVPTQLTMLTGCRLSKIQKLQWGHETSNHLLIVVAVTLANGPLGKTQDGTVGRSRSR